MSALVSPSLADVAARLRQARRVAIFSHQRPDPDALGSLSAAALILRRALPASANPIIVLFEPPPGPYGFLVETLAGVDVATFSPEWAASVGGHCDTILVVDTCTYQQLEPAKEFLVSNKDRVVAIDHHASRDPLGPLLYTDTTAAAAVELIIELADRLAVKLDEPIATRLLSGLVGDTGWFRFDSVTPRTHRIAARLVEAGAEPAKLYERLMQNETPTKLGLTCRALKSLQWSTNNRVAIMSLTLGDFADTGAAMSQTEYLVDYPMQVSTTEVAGLLTELADGRFRVSLRSKHNADVNRVCRTFGGGGHVKAAGARLDGPLAAARQRVATAIEEELAR